MKNYYYHRQKDLLSKVVEVKDMVNATHSLRFVVFEDDLQTDFPMAGTFTDPEDNDVVYDFTPTMAVGDYIRFGKDIGTTGINRPASGAYVVEQVTAAEFLALYAAHP